MVPPQTLDGAEVLAVADLADARATGKTRHHRDGEMQESGGFVHLALAAYKGEPGVYLFYCDEGWNVLNDTFHDGRAGAERQASFEFDGVQFHARE